MTLDVLPTHCNSQGSSHKVVGLNHWLTSLSLVRHSFLIELNCFRYNSLIMVSEKFMSSEGEEAASLILFFMRIRGELDHWYHLFVAI